jgi:hypothetical protein
VRSITKLLAHVRRNMAALVRFRAAFGAGNRLFGAARAAAPRSALANPFRGSYSTGEMLFIPLCTYSIADASRKSLSLCVFAALFLDFAFFIILFQEFNRLFHLLGMVQC